MYDYETNLPAGQLKLSDIIDEYNQKVKNIENSLQQYEKACNDLKTSATIRGTWGHVSINTGNVYDYTLKESLLKSAWYYVYNQLGLDNIATANDKKLFEQSMIKPPEFNMENIKLAFGKYILNPRLSILRGLAEVFCSLDPYYKSHDKMKIGVKGLPKRVIISGLSSYFGYGRDKIRDILNALAAYQGKPLVTYQELEALLKDGEALRYTGTFKHTNRYVDEEIFIVGRGVWLKKYKNGNGHLYFDEDTLKDINMALSEYYGEVLPDCHEDKPDSKKVSTEISKDLQYYPTPKAVIEKLLHDVHIYKGVKILEPSCGCGRILDVLKENGADVYGIEIDPSRAEQCRSKGHSVLTANFLETVPEPVYDYVIGNPPFYGKHYAKHIEHALKFLKDGGKLIFVLPVTARYDHGLVEKMGYKHSWSDLPVGSFTESGTNVNTTILTMFK